LHCNDCHSTGYSAHGGNNEYILQTATSENPAAEHTGPTEYVCIKCHVGAPYTDNTHVGNASDFQHSSHATGTNRLSNFTGGNNMGHITGIACLNCHDGAIGFGGAHGVPDATYTAGPQPTGGQGTYNKRRFLPGSGLRYYDPANGQAGGDADWYYVDGMGDATNQCYTLTNTTTISNCNKHDAGTALGFRNVRRPVEY